MRTLIALSALLVAAGCASTEPVQYAQAECKVQPITTTSVTGVRKPEADESRQRLAEAELATSSYRFRHLNQNAYGMNNVEDTLRDCGAAQH